MKPRQTKTVAVTGLDELLKKRQQLKLELALGKSRDSAELANMRKEIARRLTAMSKKTMINKQ